MVLLMVVMQVLVVLLDGLRKRRRCVRLPLRERLTKRTTIQKTQGRDLVDHHMATQGIALLLLPQKQRLLAVCIGRQR